MCAKSSSGLSEPVGPGIGLLSRGLRMLVIDNRQRKIDKDFDIVVWNKVLDCAVRFCSREKEDTYSGWVSYGQQELPISGDSPRELAGLALKAVSWTLKHRHIYSPKLLLRR